MNRRICRQVLDCGDGVREVTALALAAFKMPKRAADTTMPNQSGDSEDSVAAVQDARAPTRAALGSWPQCAVDKAWRLSMNLHSERDHPASGPQVLGPTEPLDHVPHRSIPTRCGRDGRAPVQGAGARWKREFSPWPIGH
ncbi:MAG: hypothetical protein L0Z50_24640 [Verrucomicrobiales bacterium]|nr:hypothetical protein [Verrucomicrobiales bacterium]